MKLMKISVIIPVLNERDCLPANLAALKLQDWLHEIIVVDGGSTDGTLEWLRGQNGVEVIETPAGRGIQLNAGARAATGDTLVFLHADSRLPQNACELLKNTLDSPQVAGGCFMVRFDHRTPRTLAIVAAGINLRTLLTRTATGDQVVFVRRSAFEEIGGFREWPLFEDIDFVSRLKQAGRFAVIRSRATISARRHIRNGVFKTVLLCYLLRLEFWAGVSPFTLARRYQRSNSCTKHLERVEGAIEPKTV
jgi:rSAM/selenodomain-associated transferase 2